MLSYKQIRISPRQGSFDTSGSKNIVDVELPSANYDLSQSSLVIDVSVLHKSTQAVEDGGGDDSGIFDSVILMDDSDLSGYGFLVSGKKDILVKNARCESSKLGLIDSATDHNSFKTNLNAITMSNEEQNSELLANSLAFQDQGLIKNQSMALLVKNGGQKSVQRSTELVIPLKDIFPSHVINNYQSLLHGNLNYHFELRLQKMNPGTVDVSDTIMDTKYNADGDSGNNAKYNAFDPIATNNEGQSVPQTLLTTTIQYKSLNDSPFHTQQKIKLSYTVQDAAAAVVDRIVKIQSIEYLNTDGADSGKLRLTVVGKWADLPDSKEITDITCKILPPEESTLSINSIQLKMMELENAPSIKTPQTISYPYFTSHRDTYSETQHQTRNYYIPPLTKTVFIVFPEKGLDKTFSADAISNYRYIVDNVPLTDTSVPYNSAKHYDLMRASFMNAGLQIKNVGSYFKNWNFPADYNGNQNKAITVLAFPVKTKAEQQVLNMELESTSNLSGQIQIVYQRIKQIVAK